MTPHANLFTPLDRLSRVPFVRKDGTRPEGRHRKNLLADCVALLVTGPITAEPHKLIGPRWSGLYAGTV